MSNLFQGKAININPTSQTCSDCSSQNLCLPVGISKSDIRLLDHAIKRHRVLPRHSISLPEFNNPGLIAGIGWLGLQHILNNGGSGYFPERLVRPYLKAGTLHRVLDAPTFRLPAYVVYPTDRDTELFDPAIAAMHRVAEEETRG